MTRSGSCPPVDAPAEQAGKDSGEENEPDAGPRLPQKGRQTLDPQPSEGLPLYIISITLKDFHLQFSRPELCHAWVDRNFHVLALHICVGMKVHLEEERASPRNKACHHQGQSEAWEVRSVGENTGQGLTDQAVAGLTKAIGRRQKKVDRQAKKGTAGKAKPQAEKEAAPDTGTEAGKATKKAAKKKPVYASQNAGKARKRDSSGMCVGVQK